jgi:hypothetical protein
MSTPTGIRDRLLHLHDLARRLDDAADMTDDYPEKLDDLTTYVHQASAQLRASAYLLAQHLRKLGIDTHLRDPGTSTSDGDEP